jgi:hypothetical protein
MSKKPEDYKWVFILGQPVHKAELNKIFILAALLLALLIVCSVDAYRYITEEFANQEALPSVLAEELHPVEAFMNGYLETTGHGSINSLRGVGNYQVGAIEMEIQLLAKPPHFYRQDLSIQGYTLEVGYDGDEL